MFGIGWGELALIFVIILVLFGPQKAQGIFKAFGQGLKEFKGAMSSLNVNPVDRPADFQDKRSKESMKEDEKSPENRPEPEKTTEKKDIGTPDE